MAPTIAFPKIRFICFIGDINDSITKRNARNNEFNKEGINTPILLYFEFRMVRNILMIVIAKNEVKNPIKRPVMNLKDNAVVVVVSMLSTSIKNREIVSNNTNIRTNM